MDASHAAPPRFSFAQIANLMELDLQSTTPSSAETEMRPFERIAKIVGERLVGDVQNVKARRADDSFTLEDRDAHREIEDRARLDAPALEVHELGSRRRLYLFEPLLFDLQRHPAFVPAGETHQQSGSVMLISDAEAAHVPLILIWNEFRAGADFNELFGQKQAAVDRAGI